MCVCVCWSGGMESNHTDRRQPPHSGNAKAATVVYWRLDIETKSEKAKHIS